MNSMNMKFEITYESYELQKLGILEAVSKVKDKIGISVAAVTQQTLTMCLAPFSYRAFFNCCEKH